MAKQILQDLDFNNVARLTNLPAPAAPNDAARLVDLNSAIEGLSWKDDVRVATQANTDLAAPGATIDGITMATSDRVLVMSQTAAAENGIYIWNGAAVPMTRSLDASTAAELEQAVVTVSEGTSAGTSKRQTAVNFTLETDAVTWGAFGTSAPAATETTAGIAELATQAETDAGTDDATIITPLKLANWSGRKRKGVADIGDGSATSYTLTHNFNTRDVTVAVYRNSGNYDEVAVEVRHALDSVTLVFAAAPTTNQFRVVVIG